MSFKSTITAFALALAQFAVAQSINVTGLSNFSYTAGQGWLNVGNGVSISGISAYDGGYIQFDVTAPSVDLGDEFRVASSANPNNLDEISFSNGIVYKGTGSSTEPIGTLDPVLNGTNGKALRINFSSAFSNPSFEEPALSGGSIAGWTPINSWINLGTTSIAGFVSPNDGTYPGNAGNDDAAPASASYTTTLS